MIVFITGLIVHLMIRLVGRLRTLIVILFVKLHGSKLLGISVKLDRLFSSVIVVIVASGIIMLLLFIILLILLFRIILIIPIILVIIIIIILAAKILLCLIVTAGLRIS